MKSILVRSTVFCAALVSLGGQAMKQDSQQRLADIKEAMAKNRAQLSQYSWTEHIQISLKGEVKKTKDDICRYGPDGKVQKTEIGESPSKQMHGLKGRIAEKKKDEMEDYMQRATALIHNYVPPSPQGIQQAYQSGNVSFTPLGAGALQITIKNYYLPGDAMTMTFDTTAKKLRGLNVNTYLDEPKDIVTLQVNFQSLPDGTNYPAMTTFDATAKQLQVQTQNSNYQRIGG